MVRGRSTDKQVRIRDMCKRWWVQARAKNGEAIVKAYL